MLNRHGLWVAWIARSKYEDDDLETSLDRWAVDVDYGVIQGHIMYFPNTLSVRAKRMYYPIIKTESAS